MNPKREAKFQSVAQRRQHNFTVILENVHDTHNIGAVLRTCDSVGINEIFALHSRPQNNKATLTLGKRTSGGTRKWVDVHFYHDLEACFEHVRSRYDKIFSTHLSDDAVSLYDMDLTGSVALLFGNEHIGVTPEALAKVDGNFIIPQVGMVQSLNISVACAVSLYEGFRQRNAKGLYDPESRDPNIDQQLMEEYRRRHEARVRLKKVPRIK